MERELFKDSLERCMQRTDFIDRFYEFFLGSSNEAIENAWRNMMMIGIDFLVQRYKS
jgi:hypothetical protein